jgi:5-methyltetrahydropteroyltriglutamate--homocysteine methyltransferase
MTRTPPFRADHVGSLLRPAALREARVRARAGAISAEELRSIEDAAIRDVIRRQESIGLQAITDGELRRDYWHMDFLVGIDGIGARESLDMKFEGVDEVPPTPIVTGPIRCTEVPQLAHFTFLAGETKGTAKFTIPAPSMAHMRGGSKGIPRAIYPDLEQYWYDLAEAYRESIRRIHAAGCRYLQIDDITFSYLADDHVRAGVIDKGDEPDALAMRYAATINQALASRPADMAVTMHTCRGNFQSTFVASSPYSRAATEAMFSTSVDAWFMEFDSDRAGGFDVLSMLPSDKQVVLGLITTKFGELESADAIARRIDQAARIVPLERLCLSPQCGFSSTHHGNKLAEDEQWRKLDRVVEVARMVWGEA